MKVLIAGWAGTGKSTLALELQAQGLPALDSDEVPGLSCWRDLGTGEEVEVNYNLPIDFNRLGWLWSPEVMDKVLAEHSDLFFCGNAGNLWDFVGKFDSFFYFTIDEATQRSRLVHRPNNIYAKEPSVLEYTLGAQRRFEAKARQAGATALDARLPIVDIAQQVIWLTNEHRRLA